MLGDGARLTREFVLFADEALELAELAISADGEESPPWWGEGRIPGWIDETN